MTRTILITGSSSGIGRATAIYFSEKGWNVAATMRHPEKEDILIHLQGIRLYRLDVTDASTITGAIRQVISDFGSIDVLVNNAGYGAIGAFEAADLPEIRQQFETNVFGLMEVTKAMLPHFRKKKQGIVINISSVAGRITLPLFSLYHASKWAVEGFSESLQYELRAFGIRVKIIEPGAIYTEFYGRSQKILQKEGLQVYDNYVNTVLPNIQKAGLTAKGPESVAAVIYKAATDGNRRLRYRTGYSSDVLLFARWLLPVRVFNKLAAWVVERKQA